MRKSTIEKRIEARKKKVEAVTMTVEDLFLLLLDGDRPPEVRQANPSQRAFVFDPFHFKAFMGPKGSAKTSAGCSAGWLRTLLQPGSKGFVCRKDYNDLKQTTKLRMEEMLRRLPKGTLLDRTKDPPETWFLEAIPVLTPEGDVIDDTASQITFVGLDAIGEAGSYEIDWAFVDEASELSDIRGIHAINGLRRNMPKWWPKVPPECRPNYSTMLAFNPTDTFHELYTACTGLDHAGRKVAEPIIRLFVANKKENQRNLPADYYDLLSATMPEDMKMRLVEGAWGSTFQGAPVVRQFKYGLHVRDDLMKEYDSYTELYRFWDFGYRRPYVVWCQMDLEGRLLAFKELMGENLEIGPFIDKAFAFQNKHFPAHREFIDYGDPAARQKKDTGSTLQVLVSRGIMLRYRITTIDEGLQAVRVWMEKIIDGYPALQFDRSGVPILINALRGGYHMDEESGQTPIKDGYYDHPVDAYRYGIVNVFGIMDQKFDTSNLPSSLEYRPEADIYHPYKGRIR